MQTPNISMGLHESHFLFNQSINLLLFLFCSSYQAQAMKQQSLLREEMMLQYKLGNFEVMPSYQPLQKFQLDGRRTLLMPSFFSLSGRSCNPEKVGSWCAPSIGVLWTDIPFSQKLFLIDLHEQHTVMYRSLFAQKVYWAGLENAGTVPVLYNFENFAR